MVPCSLGDGLAGKTAVGRDDLVGMEAPWNEKMFLLIRIQAPNASYALLLRPVRQYREFAV